MTSASRRRFIATGAAAATALAIPALAQTRAPVRLVVGFPPGGPADVLARALAEPLRVSLGTTVIVDNRPGAGGRVAADHVRTAPADGTVLLISPASVVTMSPHLYKSVRYELDRDFTPLAPLARLDLGVYAGPGTPEHVRTLADLVKWMQENPSMRTAGIPGAGSTPHLAALLLGKQTRLDWQLVPYQGGAPSFLALLSGQVPVIVDSLAGGMEHVRAGKVRLLALTTSERSSFVPDVPTLRQAGYDIVVEDRHTVFAPKATPAPVAASLRQALAQALQAPNVVEVLQRMSLERSGTVSDFPALMSAESNRWAAAVRALNISME